MTGKHIHRKGKKGCTGGSYILFLSGRRDNLGISIYNSEGYLDPTACMAIKNAGNQKTKQLPLAYICYAAADNAVDAYKRARKYGCIAVQKQVVPVVVEAFLPQIAKHNMAYFQMADNTLFRRCEEVWIFGNWGVPQMRNKIYKAIKMKKTLRFFNEDGKEMILNCLDQA